MTSVLVNLSANPDQVAQPWVWRISREHNVKVSIVKANIDADFGTMQLDLSGEVEDIQRCIAWLMTTGLHVEALSRAVGA